MKELIFQSYRKKIGRTAFDITRFRLGWMCIVSFVFLPFAIYFSIIWVITSDLEARILGVSSIAVTLLSLPLFLINFFATKTILLKDYEGKIVLTNRVSCENHLICLDCLDNNKHIEFCDSEIVRLKVYKKTIVIKLLNNVVLALPNSEEIVTFLHLKR